VNDRAADLSMIVPTYNERESIGGLVDAVFAACDPARVNVELVVVDDNSPDGTGAVADDLAKTRRMKVVHRSGKLGLGTAVMAGFAAASAPIVGVMDADYSHPPSLVPKLYAAFVSTRADMVVASRYIPGGSTGGWPLSRQLMSKFACVLARPVVPIRDATSGFFLLRRDVAHGAEIKAGGFKICIELLVRAWPVRLVEVPYRFEDRRFGQSKMNHREAAGYLFQLRDLWKASRAGGPKPRREYRALSPRDVDALIPPANPKA
jgi:dolichol-phosphate mannosyltransferase